MRPPRDELPEAGLPVLSLSGGAGRQRGAGPGGSRMTRVRSRMTLAGLRRRGDVADSAYSVSYTAFSCGQTRQSVQVFPKGLCKE